MKFTFRLSYHTDFGQSLALARHPLFPNLKGGSSPLPLHYRDASSWELSLDVPADASAAGIDSYEYIFSGADRSQTLDWSLGRSLPAGFLTGAEEVVIVDSWNNPGYFENTFYTEPFQRVLLAERRQNHGQHTLKVDHHGSWSHCFRVMAPLLEYGQTLCLLGGSSRLGFWNTASPLLLHRRADGPCFEAFLDLAGNSSSIDYKYGVFDLIGNRFVRFEDGPNRLLPVDAAPGRKSIINDGFARLPSDSWRAAGVAIPVFSLRSKRSFGVGEFTDLELLADWASNVGLKVIQILPVNDTSATFTWADSYPYAAISAFALHPIYLDLRRVAEDPIADSQPKAPIPAKNSLSSLGELAGVKEILDQLSHTLPAPARAPAPPNLAELESERARLNSLPSLDYEAVMKTKLEFLRRLYPVQRPGVFASPAYREFFKANSHWLVPYGVFCYLRDKHRTTVFSSWPEHQVWSDAAAALAAETSPVFEEIAFYFFLQFHLHRQLQAAAAHAHTRGVILKGDIPIGIHRFGVDAWQHPGLFHLEMQAGAPPDAFAVKGQNWGFPTYNWDRMRQDDFAWWKQRFAQMSEYFDAFRIDHILGFFRIWSIPVDQVEGIMGYFVPALAVQPREFADRRIPADRQRYLEPFITDAVLKRFFGDELIPAARFFLNPVPREERRTTTDFLHPSSTVSARHGETGSTPVPSTFGVHISECPAEYTLKPEFRTQRQIEHWFQEAEKTVPPPLDTLSPPLSHASLAKLKGGLYDLVSNVILFEVTSLPQAPNPNRNPNPVPTRPHEVPPQSGEAGSTCFHFRLGMESTPSFQALDPAVQNQLRDLYLDYFFRRQDQFWRQESLTKLPALRRVTNMLVCGEDLGMVPATVPEVMRQLGLLSLEVQRMPKVLNRVFSQPQNAPYLSVVTPSTHDMSTIRGWWEEDRHLIQRFWNEELGQPGEAPETCTTQANRLVIEQHLASPAMWSIFQFQDLLGIDEFLRRPNPHDERINVPAISAHYWKYRMHLDLESLLTATTFNESLVNLLRANRRS